MTVWHRMFLVGFAALLLMTVALAQQEETAPVNETAAEAAADESTLEAEDAEVDDILRDVELIYKDEDDFTPSQSISADQSVEYPVDI
ncbi:MAG: hypothetical protein AAGF46_04525 [Pseudomonadota bacterium]